jgi:Ca2+-binding EF-hand superfamily protein
MYIKCLALVTFVATALGTPAFADAPAGGHGGFLKSADLNKDGVIDQTEFQNARDKWFGDLDSDKDGFVSADELKAFGDKMHAEWAKKHADQAKDKDKDKAEGKHRDFSARILKRVDTDEDGKISKAEFDAEGSKLFARLDGNADGKIADNEMPHRHWARFGGHMFDRLDADHDGKVTKAEFQAAGDKMFQRMDKNGDGTIEKDEMSHGKHGDVPPAGQTPNP